MSILMTAAGPTTTECAGGKPPLIDAMVKLTLADTPHASNTNSPIAMLGPVAEYSPGSESPATTADKLMKERFSCRFFLPREVPRSTIEELIDAARFAPSGNNIQPWEKVYCLTGLKLSLVSVDILKAFMTEPQAHKAQYEYYPPLEEMPAPYGERRQGFGKALGTVLGIERMDVKKRAEAAGRNYQFYGAPMALVVTINKGLRQGSWLDVGFFLQSIALGARARGLEVVTQESPTQYHAVLRRHLPISDDEIVAVCVSMGYPDMELVTKYQMPRDRRDVQEIMSFYD